MNAGKKFALQLPGRGKALKLFILLVFSACAGLLLVNQALASPEELEDKQAQVDAVKSEIESINSTAEAAIERYNTANTELAITEQNLVQNEAALEDAQRQLIQARYRLTQRLQSIYKGGSLGFMEVILNTSSFSDFVTRFDMLDRINDQDRDDIERVIKYSREIEEVQADLEATRISQEQLLGSVAAEKDQVEASLAAKENLLASVESEIAELATEQIAQEQQAEWSAVEELPQEPEPAPVPEVEEPEDQDEQTPAAEEEPETPAPTSDSDDETNDEDPATDDPPPAMYGGAVPIAEQYLGVPYVWGGASPAGFDCSGLVLYVYAQLGLSLPHSAAAQYYSGTPISYSQLEPGDLVFFGHPINHVGIYIGGGSMIHAPFEGEVVSISGVGGGGSYAGATRL